MTNVTYNMSRHYMVGKVIADGVPEDKGQQKAWRRDTAYLP